jgi:hypothetical protein
VIRCFGIRLVAAYLDPQVYAQASSAEMEHVWEQIENAADNEGAALTRRIMGRNSEGKWKRLDEMNGRRADLLYLAVTWQSAVGSTHTPPV